ncbi:NADH:ubiquinone oxidoreductase subunit V3 [Anticarsia gemmatalis]|uniref:NADH:ubiquinone oxidoreductase subunit V3 n=1 Tax=Anticarsia gemmatalis TaxID=129554 RepID=UPI003F75F5D7
MNVLRRNTLRTLTRYYSEGAQSSSSSAGLPKDAVPNVPGLSSSVIQPAPGPVGPNVEPNKSGAYKVPEYFCYDNMSFFEAEIEMSKFRCPQPSAIKK